MASLDELSDTLARHFIDYREGEIAPPSATHVKRWIEQFPLEVRVPVLSETTHLLKTTYLSRLQVTGFVVGLIHNRSLAGENPRGFWQQANFLDIQNRGASQATMLAMFDSALQTETGLSLANCGSSTGPYIYLDDAIFTGGHVRTDISEWLAGLRPGDVTLHVVVAAYHRYGQWYADREIAKAARNAGISLKICWWRCVEVEDRKSYMSSSDVLRPTALPDDPLVTAYVESFTHPLVLRTGASIGEMKFFSSPEARHVLEQEFLKAGCRIRSICPNLNQFQRPLGNVILETLGFGALFVTFRNCANNCPLVFWAGDPWYPLFPRKTN